MDSIITVLALKPLAVGVTDDYSAQLIHFRDRTLRLTYFDTAQWAELCLASVKEGCAQCIGKSLRLVPCDDDSYNQAWELTPSPGDDGTGYYKKVKTVVPMTDPLTAKDTELCLDATQQDKLKTEDCDASSAYQNYFHVEFVPPTRISPPSPPPPVYPPGVQNVYESNVPGVGGWGGTCTCPDGAVYDVGDWSDDCASLACVGGLPGTCHSSTQPGAGKRVICAVAPPPVPSPPPVPIYTCGSSFAIEAEVGISYETHNVAEYKTADEAACRVRFCEYNLDHPNAPAAAYSYFDHNDDWALTCFLRRDLANPTERSDVRSGKLLPLPSSSL